MGRLELRSFQGFRFNDTFANLSKRISMKLTNNISETLYTLRLFPGNTMGHIIFTLWVKPDFALNEDSVLARFFIDDIELTTTRNIVV